MKKEWALEPYSSNLGEYDLKTRIQQGKWLLKQQAGIHFALGCVLMEIKERENLQSFAKIISNEFGGMSQRNAYNCMTFAKKCVDLKKIKEFAEDNWAKVIALLHGTTEEQLKEIEEKGINGKALDEFDGMSVSQFKKQLMKYKAKAEGMDDKELRRMIKRNEGLEEENKRLKTASKIPELPEEFADYMKEIEHKVTEIIVMARRLNFDEVHKDVPEGPIRAKYYQSVKIMETQFKNIIEDMREHIIGKE